jgi:hypothetical protein
MFDELQLAEWTHNYTCEIITYFWDDVVIALITTG